MTELEQLRVAFCSILLQAKGPAVSSFVAWLDLKVAEFKVYGHMILTDDKESDECGACQFNLNADPSTWPKSSLVREHCVTNNTTYSSARVTDTNHATPRNTQSSSSSRRKGRPSYISRVSPFAMRNRVSRPAKSIVSSLLKNAISRSAKHLPTIPYSGVVGGNGAIADSATTNDASVTMETEESDQRSGNLAIDYPDGAKNDIKTEPSDEVPLEKPTTCVAVTNPIMQPLSVKTEQTAVESGDDEEFNVIEPESPDSTDEENMWVSEPTGSSVFPDMPDFSSGAALNASLPSTSSHEFSGAVIRRSSHKQLLPSRHSYPGPVQSATSPTASQTSPSRSLLTSVSPTPKRSTTRSRDSVNDLLETHTIQTESGLICRICESKVKRRTHMRAHLLEQHLGIVHRCPVCKHTFTRHRALRYHMDKVHPTYPPFYPAASSPPPCDLSDL